MSAASPPAERPRAGEPGEFRFPRGSRIQAGEDIRNLMRRGERKRMRHVDVFFAASPVAIPRFGLVVPKHRHRIVERNRLKRRLREIARTEVLPRLRQASRPLDVLVRARPEAYSVGFDVLRDELTMWVESRS